MNMSYFFIARYIEVHKSFIGNDIYVEINVRCILSENFLTQMDDDFYFDWCAQNCYEIYPFIAQHVFQKQKKTHTSNFAHGNSSTW